MCWRFEASACFRGTRGQATVEAALLIPALLLGLVIAAQPGIVLFDRVVMEARLLNTCSVDSARCPLFPLFMRACGMLRCRVRGRAANAFRCAFPMGTGPCRSWGKGWAFWALWAAMASFAKRFFAR